MINPDIGMEDGNMSTTSREGASDQDQKLSPRSASLLQSAEGPDAEESQSDAPAESSDESQKGSLATPNADASSVASTDVPLDPEAAILAKKRQMNIIYSRRKRAKKKRHEQGLKQSQKELERKNESLRAENQRLERLLGYAAARVSQIETTALQQAARFPSYQLGLASALGMDTQSSLPNAGLHLGRAALTGQVSSSAALGTLGALPALSRLNNTLGLPASLGLNLPNTTNFQLSGSQGFFGTDAADRLSALQSSPSMTQALIQRESLALQNNRDILASLGVGTGLPHTDVVTSSALRSATSQLAAGVSNEALLSQLLRRSQPHSFPSQGQDADGDQSGIEKRQQRPFE